MCENFGDGMALLTKILQKINEFTVRELQTIIVLFDEILVYKTMRVPICLSLVIFYQIYIAGKTYIHVS